MEKTILSIDCGTQSLRAIIFSLKGEVLAIQKIPFEPYTSPKAGWAEQDPEIYWHTLKVACNKLKRESAHHFSSIVGVGVTALRDSMVNVNKNGEPLRPLMIWLDQRKAKPVFRPEWGLKILIKTMGLEDTLTKAQREGKCNWIRQNQPAIWENTYKYLQVSGFLHYRLTGEFKDSVASQIGHIPFDYKKQKWGNPKNLLAFSTKLYPVEKEKLPELVQPGEIIGGIDKKASEETGLPENLPLVACGSDKGCETLGMGVVNTKLGSLSFGTTATIQTTSERYIEPIKFMPAYPATIPGLFNPEVEIFRGFWMITWFKNEFAQKEVEQAKKKGISEEEALNKLLSQSPPGSMGLVVQPYWSPGLSEPAAKGAIIGFGDVHKKPHVYRAVIEGLAFALKEGKEKIERVSGQKMEKLAVSGGASQSNEICQIAADIFDLPIIRGQTSETSGLGAAIITAWATGNYISLEEATKNMVKYKDEFQPNTIHVDFYRKLYKKVYKKMYRKLEPLYNEIREITGYPE
ncbi:FGGY-family carbohydrate kinase [Maribellus maritimus]|uniref:FGGY-family carbohydrate kinase n=1 Tax=Maribellus maritimus TaxID=2870838 RepID=UPI001EEA77C0|nr:FGGY-family carbohydrate kinase [Maribellus maritimus]MCG6188014.1 FGGY-family carbohydrate kinase [Maribellus maritimus]